MVCIRGKCRGSGLCHRLSSIQPGSQPWRVPDSSSRLPGPFAARTSVRLKVCPGHRDCNRNNLLLRHAGSKRGHSSALLAVACTGSRLRPGLGQGLRQGSRPGVHQRFHGNLARRRHFQPDHAWCPAGSFATRIPCSETACHVHRRGRRFRRHLFDRSACCALCGGNSLHIPSLLRWRQDAQVVAMMNDCRKELRDITDFAR